MANKAQIVFIPHGGGPLPLLGEPGHKGLVEFLQGLAATLTKPKAILMISAHWEATQATVTFGDKPELIYDYYGFPDEAYQIQYPASGEPNLAEKVASLLEQAKIPVEKDSHRGFDHGMFVPLKIMYPAADIPCVQLSLLESMDANAHIALGKALSALREENILVLGSGFSFHNLRAMMAGGIDVAQNQAFENWLIDTCTKTDISETQRRDSLVDWAKAPGARYCHPREEHLLPLHVCYGIAQSPAELLFSDKMLGAVTSAYLWR